MSGSLLTISEFTNLQLLNGLSQIKNFNSFLLIQNKISKCNACDAKPFVDAYCEVVRPKETVDVFSLSSIYNSGLNVLDAFLKTGMEPENTDFRIALKRLVEFAEGSEWEELSIRLRRCQWTEAELSIILLHHCLSKLISSKVGFPAYVVDKYCTKQEEKCPCCVENTSGVFGDTSIGNTEVWHGRVDAVIAGMIGLIKFGGLRLDDEPEPCPSSPQESSAIDEVKKGIHVKDIHQILAQTITLAFLQNSMHPEEVSLYPNISIGPRSIQLHFYDSVNDILLESYEEKLFDDDDLNWAVLVALWLVVNHSVFCSGITESMKTCDFTADFLNGHENVKEVYRRKLTYHCGAVEKKELSLKKFVAEAKKANTLKYHKDESPFEKKFKFETCLLGTKS